MGSGSKYAGIHETGGRIRPKRRRALAVPLEGARTKAGNLKGRYVNIAPSSATLGGTYIEKGERTLYANRDLIFIHSGKQKAAGKPPILAEIRGKGKSAQIIPKFVLLRSVKIPARLRFYATFRSWVRRPAALRFFKRGITRLWNRLIMGRR